MEQQKTDNQEEEKVNIKPEESERVKILKTALGSILLNLPLLAIFGLIMMFFFGSGPDVSWGPLLSNLIYFVILFNILSSFLLSRRRHKKSLKVFFAIFFISLLPYIIYMLRISTL